MIIRNFLLMIIFLLPATQGIGHHSETAEFDSNDPVSLTGVISAVEWNNPHVWFYVDVTNDDGSVSTWGFSTAPPGMWMRRGITKEVLQIGATINVEGSRARDGSNNASGRRITFPDGSNVFTASEGGR